MAWRPNSCLIEGMLDNTKLGKVTGWMKFAGMQENIRFDLDGDFHRDIRGCRLQLKGDGEERDRYMEGFAIEQKGSVGDMTVGLPTGEDEGEPTYEYVDYPYIEWYGDANGRVCIELTSDDVTILGSPIPVAESDPINREEQEKNMENFMNEMGDSFKENLENEENKEE